MAEPKKRKNDVTSKVTIIRVPADQIDFRVLLDAIEEVKQIKAARKSTG